MAKTCGLCLVECLLGRKMLSGLGWVIVMLITACLILVNSVTVTSPWWGIDFTGDACSERFYVLWLRWGMCRTSSSQEINIQDCIAFQDTDAWEEVDRQSGSNTDQARKVIYPSILLMNSISLGLLGIQMIVCMVQWKQMYHHMLPQRLTMGLSTAWLFLTYGSQTIGYDTYINRASTWEYTTDCTDDMSYPGVGFAVANSFGLIFFIFLYIVLNYPTSFRRV